jgi:type I restriction enzyme M protein
LLNNNKPANKKDQVLIINARDQFEKEPKSFGNKRNRIIDDHRNWIHYQFESWSKTEQTKIFHTTDFAFHKVEVVFWQEDENGQQMWITEELDVQLNNGNVKKRFELYGDMTFYITINEEIKLEVHYDGSKAFETLVAEKLKKGINEFKAKTLNEIKKWFKAQDKTADFHHRHYIVDNEYIPFEKKQNDKEAYINAFLAKEIGYEIIRWQEYEQLGYEILPNKYFYKYQEPTPSDELIKEFWQLEEDAEKLLKEIREL